MSDLKSARKITKALKFLRYAYVFQKNLQNVHCVFNNRAIPQTSDFTTQFSKWLQHSNFRI